MKLLRKFNSGNLFPYLIRKTYLVNCQNYKLTVKEMETLINHYGSVQKSSKFGQVHYQGPDISADESMTEFAGFKYLIHTKRKEQEQQFPDQIFNSHRLWLLLSKNDVHKEIYPNCFKLFKLLMIFPLSAACVERLFSKMKIVKNRLRNSLSNATLEFAAYRNRKSEGWVRR